MPSMRSSVRASLSSAHLSRFFNRTLMRLVLAVTGAMVLVLCGAWSPARAQAKPATTTTLAVMSGGSAVTTVGSYNVVTLTATVKAGATAVTTGQVNFCDAFAAYCTDIHLLGTAQLTSAGTATMNFRPGAGSHSYKAVFAGTYTSTASSSAAAVLTVTIGGGQHSAATLL